MSAENGQPTLDPVVVCGDKLAVHCKDHMIVCTMHNGDFRWNGSSRTYMVGAIKRLLWDLEEQEREETRRRLRE